MSTIIFNFRNAKVLLVGCSYAGSMATWMRLGYPHLVDAVFSDSGPIVAKEDFYGKYTCNLLLSPAV